MIRVLDVDGCETLELNGSLYQDASSVSPIFSGPESWCIIRPGQTARWYRTGEAAGSQMTVEVPENGGFYVYDAALASRPAPGSMETPPLFFRKTAGSSSPARRGPSSTSISHNPEQTLRPPFRRPERSFFLSAGPHRRP